MKGARYMTDLKVVSKVSDRLDKKGRPFTDLYLVWTYDSKVYEVRIRPQFFCDFDKLYALSKTDK